MAGCNDYGCNCLVRGGAGITVTGAGTDAQPYVIGIEGGVSDALQVLDSTTINFTLNGGGTADNPYILTASATLALTQLSDVSDPQGAPQVGDVPVWVGTGPTAHWEFQPPPIAPAGATNVSTGLTGVGSVGDPIRVRLIGTTAGGSTSGLEVYADAVGNLRAVPPAVSTVQWNDVQNKPTVFPSNDANFTGPLSVAKGGTGATSLDSITVGNATRVGNIRIYVQSTTPTGMSTNDLWFWGA